MNSILSKSALTAIEGWLETLFCVVWKLILPRIFSLFSMAVCLLSVSVSVGYLRN